MLGKHLWADKNAPLTTTTYSTQDSMLTRGSGHAPSPRPPAWNKLEIEHALCLWAFFSGCHCG